jgi:hypothetical protein
VTNKDVNIVKEIRQLELITTIGIGIQGALSLNSNVKVASTTKNVRPRIKKIMFLDILKDIANSIAIMNYILD